MDLSADALNSSEAQPESASSEDPAMPLCDLAFRPWCSSSALWFVSLKRGGTGEMRMRGGVGIGLDLRTRTFMFGLGVCSAAAGFCERHQIMAVRARVHFRLRFYI